MISEYFFSATLPEDASTYVTRQADSELFEALKAGKFSYVLNSRQTGKSSLRVQVMRRLEKEGFKCAAIDLSIGGSQQVTSEQWYAGILRSLKVELELNINLVSWWREREWLSPLERFREFIESILLVQKTENIAIFIDEIDSVLSLDFPSDDFFAFIRACYNQRVDNAEYKRLTFCLLGVATPSDLIADKQRTPFNIGQAIELKGFTLEEAKPYLIQGLTHKVENPEWVLTQVLEWTLGQPFLTQKLCYFVVTKAESRKPNIEGLVRKYIIDNWESQDNPQHLKTIRDRILSNEQRAVKMLGIYQKILLQGHITADNSPEQTQLLLSGLIVKQHGKLKVYNRIYESVFNDIWLQEALADLRPYSDMITAWLNSSCQDESRLLRGQALQEAKAWAFGKSLSEQDYNFFSASEALEKREIQIAFKEKEEEAQILAQANQTLTDAQDKAKQTIQIAIIILTGTIFVAVTALLAAFNSERVLQENRAVSRIQREAARARDQFSWSSKRENTEALLSAMRAGQSLQALVKDSRSLQEYPTTTPLLVLQDTLSGINQMHQFNIVHDISFSANGQRLATAHRDGTAKIWDLSGKQLAVLKGHQGGVYSVNFSSDGQRITTVGGDNTARVWDVSGKQLFKINWKQYSNDIDRVKFSPDGQRLIGIEDDKIVRVWNLQGKQLAQWKVEPNGIYNLSFSPNGQLLTILGQDDNTIRLWDLSGKQLAQWTLGLGAASRVDFSSNGQRLITFDTWRDTIAVWDLSGNLIAQGKVELSGSDPNFTPDGQSYATVSADGDMVQLLDLSGKLLAEIKGQPYEFRTVTFSPDGKLLATGGTKGAVSIWDLSGKRVAEIIKDKPQPFDSVLFKTSTTGFNGFSWKGQLIATVENDTTVMLWNSSGQLLTKFRSDRGKINQVSLSSDGLHLATVATVKGSINLTVEGIDSPVAESKTPDSESVVQIWNLSGKLLAQFKGHQGNVLSVRFSPNGQRIATKGEDGTARVWDLSGHQLAEIELEGKVNDVSFSSDERHLITVTKEGKVRLWELSGKQLAEWKVAQDHINYVSFSTYGQRLATAKDDGTVRIWDLSGRKLAELKGDRGNITNVQFSLDGQRIATLESDEASIWDLSGRQIGIFSNFRGFSPDGQYVATQESDTVKLQRIRGLDDLLAEGCDLLQDYFVTHPKALEELYVCQKK
ncbi:hypothetical protein F7734_07530 [Scytonema sp. UIC 10036]|uniref:AAA-like domain-containing protein n=1 Tax=Scytonema sp. UIC 10036 TaxID=2304196 RepID=UPI0012DAEB48|nr:AAA-like domain-containing protein [Scytonema sp. UIC 10036]MUG92315.1 hypothetical protein [Scytonema sp. UIC 10036]